MKNFVLEKYKANPQNVGIHFYSKIYSKILLESYNSAVKK